MQQQRPRQPKINKIIIFFLKKGASQVVQWQRYLPTQEIQEIWVQSLGLEDPMEEGMVTHSSILV